MENELSLVILAAGMGSRFGGLKQIEPVGPNNEFIIDYSIYDAIKAGFNKIVFIIKEENYEVFRDTIGKRIEGKVKVEYAFQRIDDLPEGYAPREIREKPWGTAHAIMCAKDYINSSFAMINSDDFYGGESFKVLVDFLKENKTGNPWPFCMVGYKAINTMPPLLSVKRGVCTAKDGFLSSLTECKIQKQGDEILASPLSNEDSFTISFDTLVSMNMFGFTKDIMGYLKESFPKFLDKNIDVPNSEFLIPDMVFQAIKEKKATVKVLNTNAVWYGVTYKEDKDEVVKAINQMIDQKIYPKNLWEE